MIEAIISSSELYSKEVKEKLFKNIIVIGGGSQIKGLKDRLARDLRR